jgi:hypothetical protein
MLHINEQNKNLICTAQMKESEGKSVSNDPDCKKEFKPSKK